MHKQVSIRGVFTVVRKLLSERPILVGGLGLAASLSLLGGMHEVLADGTTLASLIAAGTGIWWWRRQRPPASIAEVKPVTAVERETVETAIASLQADLAALKTEMGDLGTDDTEATCQRFETCRQSLLSELDRTVLKLAIAGRPKSGKSSLLNPLQALRQGDPTPSLALDEINLTADSPHRIQLADLLVNYDAVVYLLTEDLTESAMADLKVLSSAGQRVLVGLNKQDHYLPEDRVAILEQVQKRLKTLPTDVEGVAIATAPKPIKVRVHDEAGETVERIETPLAEVAPVTSRVEAWLAEEVPHLVTQTVMRQVQQLRRDIQSCLNQVRRQQAMPLVEQLQWTAAATAFASPVPSLDLLATIAINGQLVMDLGRVYHQPLALDQAKTIAAELATVVVKLGIVEVSTQLLTTALKSHAATYVVGGGVQAFSAAYLTRLCGEGLMAYFEERALAGQAAAAWSVEAIGQKLQTLLPKTQRAEFLQSLINQGIQTLSPKTAAALPPSTGASVDFSQNAVTTVVTSAETLSSGEPA